MNLFFFFIKIKYKTFFLFQNWKEILSNIILLIFFAFFGYVIGHAYNSYLLKKDIKNSDLLITLFCSILYLTPLFFRLFFSNFQKIFSISRNYPLSKITTILLDLSLFGFLKVINLHLLIFLFSFAIASNYTIITTISIGLSFLIAGILFVENLINAINFGNKKYFIYLSMLFIFFSFSLSGLKLSLFLLQIDLIIGILFLILVYFNFYKLSDINLIRQRNYLFLKNIHYKLINENVYLKKSLILAFSFKLIIFFYIIYLLKFKYHTIYETSLLNRLLTIFVFPIVLFTYVFNNLWGYFKILAINLIISGNSFNVFLSHYLKLLKPFLLIDFVLACLLLFIFGNFSFSFILTYFLYSLYAICIGSLGSLLLYFPVIKAMSFSSIKGNASIFINIISLLGIVPFAFFKESNFHSYFFLLIPFIFVLIVFILLKFFDNKIINLFKPKLLK